MANRKVRNLQIGIDKFVGKVSFIISCKVSYCVISIIIIVNIGNTGKKAKV